MAPSPPFRPPSLPPSLVRRGPDAPGIAGGSTRGFAVRSQSGSSEQRHSGAGREGRREGGRAGEGEGERKGELDQSLSRKIGREEGGREGGREEGSTVVLHPAFTV